MATDPRSSHEIKDEMVLAPSETIVSDPLRVAQHDTGLAYLPPEILSHVFMLGAEDPPEDEDSSSLDSSPDHFGTLCSHICKYWRNVATETPQLWAFIDFQEGPPFEKSREWISRSKAVPLVLEYDDTDVDDKSYERDAEIFMKQMSRQIEMIFFLIIPHAHRWASLEITVDRYQVVWIWEKHLESCPPTPNLENLYLFCHEESYDDEHFQPEELRNPRRIVLDAPKLANVTFWGVHIDWEAATFLKNLKSLELAYHTKDVRLSVEQFVSVLDRSPRIESLSLEGSAPIPGDWPYERVALNFLHTLAIIDVDVAMAVAVVEHLDFPALRVVTLDLDHDTTVEPFISAVCKRNRSRFRDVESLKLTSFPCHRPAALQFLKSMPKLSSMALNFSFLPSHFYLALSQQPKGQTVCPNLSTLKISGLDGGELRDLIIARKAMHGAKPVQRLYLDKTDDFEDKAVEWLKENLELLEFYEPSDDEDDEDDEDDDDEWEDEEDEEDDEGEEDDVEWDDDFEGEEDTRDEQDGPQ